MRVNEAAVFYMHFTQTVCSNLFKLLATFVRFPELRYCRLRMALDLNIYVRAFVEHSKHMPNNFVIPESMNIKRSPHLNQSPFIYC